MPTVEFCLVVSQFYVSLLLTMQSIKIGTKFRDRGTRQGGMVTRKMVYMVYTSGTGQCEVHYSTRIGNHALVWIQIGAAQRSLCRLESLR